MALIKTVLAVAALTSLFSARADIVEEYRLQQNHLENFAVPSCSQHQINADTTRDVLKHLHVSPSQVDCIDLGIISSYSGESACFNYYVKLKSGHILRDSRQCDQKGLGR